MGGMVNQPGMADMPRPQRNPNARIRLTQNGTAALPAYSFLADPDTGMFLQASNQLGFAVGGALVLRVVSGTLLLGGTNPLLAFQDDPNTGLQNTGTDALALLTNGLNRININNVGIITMPAQCSFLAHNSTIDSNVTGNGAAFTVIFDEEIYDQNADFDGTSTFTAPVTGRYLLIASVNVTDLSGASLIDLRIIASKRTFVKQIANPDDDEINVSIQAFVDMDASDTATITVTVSGMGGGDVADIDGAGTNPLTWFSGQLLA